MTDWARVASRRLARLGRLGWIAAAVFCGAAALMAVWALLSWEGGYHTKSLDEIGYLVCLVFAAGCAAMAARSATGRLRYGWLALVVALSAWALGMVVRIFEEIRVDGHLYHPTLSQGVLMVFPVAAYACLLLMGGSRQGSAETDGARRDHRGDVVVRRFMGVRAEKPAR